MALANDLLDQAEHLAHLDERKPKQANLRRATSSAYYALFHLLIREAIDRLGPRRPVGLDLRIGRVFTHGEMKQVCRSIMDRRPSQVLADLVPEGFSGDLEFVARCFVELQEARHKADYDIAATQSRTEALEFVRQVRDAFAAWTAVRMHDEANVFLAALLFAGRWAK